MGFVWFLVGFVCGVVFLSVIAAVITSGMVSRMEEKAHAEKREKIRAEKKFEFDIDL